MSEKSSLPKQPANTETPAKTPGHRLVREPAQMLALEQRLMFDGAAMASVTADRPLPSDDPLLPLYRQALQETPPLRLALPVAAPLTERIADQHVPAMDASVPATAPKEHALIVLASSLAALQVELQAQHPDAIVRLLPADAEPLQAIANLLSQEKGLTEVHLISHGAPGALVFGDLRVDQAYLNEHASTLTAWKDALAPGADLLLYGCDIGAQGTASVFLQQLQTTLGVDLAASSDTTGSSAKGADAQLEVVLGQVDSHSVLSAELLDKLGLMLDSVAPTVTSASVALNDRSLQITLTLSESVSASTSLTSTRLNIVVGNETLLATLDSNASDAASGKLVYTTSSSSSMAADGFSLGTIDLNGASIQDASGNAMVTGTLNAKITEVTSPDSPVLTLVVDTSAPAAPGMPDLLASDDWGQSDSDNITSVMSPNFSIALNTAHAAAGDTLQLLSGTQLVGSVVLTASHISSGTVTLGLSSALPEGAHSLSSRLVDVAGNTGTASGALSVVLDKTAPAAARIGGFASDSGVTDDSLTNDSTLTVYGTSEAGSEVLLFDGNTPLGVVIADSKGQWQLTTTALLDGSHSLTVKNRDTAGNVGVSSAPTVVTIDSAAPNLTLATVAINDNINAAEKAAGVTINGSSEVGATVQVSCPRRNPCSKHR